MLFLIGGIALFDHSNMHDRLGKCWTSLTTRGSAEHHSALPKGAEVSKNTPRRQRIPSLRLNPDCMVWWTAAGEGALILLPTLV